MLNRHERLRAISMMPADDYELERQASARRWGAVWRHEHFLLSQGFDTRTVYELIQPELKALP